MSAGTPLGAPASDLAVGRLVVDLPLGVHRGFREFVGQAVAAGGHAVPFCGKGEGFGVDDLGRVVIVDDHLLVDLVALLVGAELV